MKQVLLMISLITLAASCKMSKATLKSSGSSELNYALSNACLKDHKSWCEAIANITNKPQDCSVVDEHSLFLISSFSYEKKSQFHGVDTFAESWSPAIGSSALCLPVNPLLASLASSSNAQDEVRLFGQA